LTELRNPLTVEQLVFKRAVVYKGDISAFSATTDGITTSIEGDATLPQQIGAFGSDLHIALYYVTIPDNSGMTYIPPAQWSDDTVIGPVDSLQEWDVGGFVLIIEPSIG
jgi:hypothetical protein